MKKVWHRNLAIFLLSVLLAVGIAANAAAFGGHAKKYKMHHLLDKIGATEEQRSQINAITEEFKEQAGPLRKELKDVMTGEMSLTNAAEFNETEVRALARQKAAIMEELTVKRAKMKSDIHNILTAEQIEILQALKAEKGERMRQHFKHNRLEKNPRPMQDLQ